MPLKRTLEDPSVSCVSAANDNKARRVTCPLFRHKQTPDSKRDLSMKSSFTPAPGAHDCRRCRSRCVSV